MCKQQFQNSSISFCSLRTSAYICIYICLAMHTPLGTNTGYYTLYTFTLLMRASSSRKDDLPQLFLSTSHSTRIPHSKAFLSNRKVFDASCPVEKGHIGSSSRLTFTKTTDKVHIICARRCFKRQAPIILSLTIALYFTAGNCD